MISYPNAKINLGLHVISERPDGFHNIETVFYPIGLNDALEIIEAKDDHFSFTASGLPIPGDPASNLCVKAYNLLLPEIQERCHRERSKGTSITPETVKKSVIMHLHKVIPTGAGLGGGSADGAFALRMLNDLFNLGCSAETLQEYARQLGSDTPFFLINSPVFASERGDVFQPIRVDLSGYKLVVVIPDIHVSTPEAYSMVRPGQPALSIPLIISKPVESWKGLLINDFEMPLVRKYPVIGEIKQRLYDLGAIYAAMSGSGSALFGIFKHDPGKINSFPGCFTWKS